MKISTVSLWFIIPFFIFGQNQPLATDFPQSIEGTWVVSKMLTDTVIIDLSSFDSFKKSCPAFTGLSHIDFSNSGPALDSQINLVFQTLQSVRMVISKNRFYLYGPAHYTQSGAIYQDIDSGTYVYNGATGILQVKCTDGSNPFGEAAKTYITPSLEFMAEGRDGAGVYHKMLLLKKD